MSPKKTLILVIAIIISICIILVFLFFYFFEIVEDEVYTGFTGEARTNQFFASQKLLEKREIEFKNIYSEYQLDYLPVNGTIFILTGLNEFSNEVLEKLLNWAIDGGNLIICISGKYTENISANIILDYLDIKINPLAGGQSEHLTFTLPNYNKSINVLLDREIDFKYSTTNTPILEIEALENIFFLQFKIGSGNISFTGQPIFMDNKHIGEYNNAQFFYYLANVDNSRNVIWYVIRNTKLSFIELLWKHGWIFIISLIIFVFLIIWRYSMRFGPLIGEMNNKRRSLIEHVHASGRFLWNKKHGTTLIMAIEKSIKWQILYKNPLWNNLSELEKIEWLDNICGVKINSIKEYFDIILDNQPKEYKNIRLKQKDFFRIIKLLRRMQKTL